MLENVSPVSYNKGLTDKKKEPAFSMGQRYEAVDKRVIVSPAQYNIPSKMVERPGKSIGAKLGSAIMNKTMNVPGPGTYKQDKMKSGDFRYSMGTKLQDVAERRLKVPGPGSYDGTDDMKF